MAKHILGAALANARAEELKSRVEALKLNGVEPNHVIVRFGDQAGDLAYERGIIRTFAPIGIQVETQARRTRAAERAAGRVQGSCPGSERSRHSADAAFPEAD
jgi:5,10-methylene-tetrahydrofolate dehydrogenase/methenyl tetrahydrofolate cyclohydrolase